MCFFRGMTAWVGFTSVQIPFQVVAVQRANQAGLPEAFETPLSSG